MALQVHRHTAFVGGMFSSQLEAARYNSGVFGRREPLSSVFIICRCSASARQSGGGHIAAVCFGTGSRGPVCGLSAAYEAPSKRQ